MFDPRQEELSSYKAIVLQEDNPLQVVSTRSSPRVSKQLSTRGPAQVTLKTVPGYHRSSPPSSCLITIFAKLPSQCMIQNNERGAASLLEGSGQPFFKPSFQNSKPLPEHTFKDQEVQWSDDFFH